METICFDLYLTNGHTGFYLFKNKAGTGRPPDRLQGTRVEIKLYYYLLFVYCCLNLFGCLAIYLTIPISY